MRRAAVCSPIHATRTIAVMFPGVQQPMPGYGVTRRRSHLPSAQRERHGMPCPISMDADLMTPIS